jgi:hypothetical protein
VTLSSKGRSAVNWSVLPACVYVLQPLATMLADQARPMHELLRLTCLLALLTVVGSCKDICDGGADVPAISSADYDRSCSVDADCVSVPEGNLCEDCALYCLQTGAVNKRVEAQYRSDVATLVRPGSRAALSR